MNSCKSSFFNRHSHFVLLAFLVLTATSRAETYEFRVVFANVPGIEEIEAGNYDAAIKLLESRARASDRQYITDELATLCALYIVKGRFSAASVTCHDAVETDGSDTAYNNRGVLRAHIGYTVGALEDFKRARVLPSNLQHYIAERMKSDARLIASGNYEVARRFTARKSQTMAHSLADRVQGASIEDITN
jgi:hypothetical protein